MACTTLRGIVRGKTIELEELPGLAEGQLVAVEVRPLATPGDGIRASAGGWSDAGPDLDKWLGDIYRARHSGRSVAQ